MKTFVVSISRENGEGLWTCNRELVDCHPVWAIRIHLFEPTTRQLNPKIRKLIEKLKPSRLQPHLFFLRLDR